MEEKEAAASSSSRRQPLSAITQHERVSSSADVAVSGARSRSGRVEEIGARSRLSLSLSLSLSPLPAPQICLIPGERRRSSGPSWRGDRGLLLIDRN